jgi:hypothetical protein
MYVPGGAWWFKRVTHGSAVACGVFANMVVRQHQNAPAATTFAVACHGSVPVCQFTRQAGRWRKVCTNPSTRTPNWWCVLVKHASRIYADIYFIDTLFRLIAILADAITLRQASPRHFRHCAFDISLSFSPPLADFHASHCHIDAMLPCHIFSH